MVVMIISDNYNDIKKTFFQPEVECFGETRVEKQHRQQYFIEHKVSIKTSFANLKVGAFGKRHGSKSCHRGQDRYRDELQLLSSFWRILTIMTFLIMTIRTISDTYE